MFQEVIVSAVLFAVFAMYGFVAYVKAMTFVNYSAPITEDVKELNLRLYARIFHQELDDVEMDRLDESYEHKLQILEQC